MIVLNKSNERADLIVWVKSTISQRLIEINQSLNLKLKRVAPPEVQNHLCNVGIVKNYLNDVFEDNFSNFTNEEINEIYNYYKFYSGKEHPIWNFNHKKTA